MKKVINVLLKTKAPWKAAANLAAYRRKTYIKAYIKTYITNIEKESKLSKTGYFSKASGKCL